jgi:2-keto-4-pentenoate hydratase/2-oxohepta-3-ene-1,7-dioic acid hydratase in catechol pathway
MKLVSFSHNGTRGVGVLGDGAVSGRLSTDPRYPGDLDDLIRSERSNWQETLDLSGAPFPLETIEFRPPFSRANKIICVGLNYRDHTDESGYKQPDYPTLFTRFNTSLIGHRASIVRPRVSNALDFEGELVAVIGRGGRHIGIRNALRHVAGYSIFNDASIRDYQHRTPQWTVGKNFDGTGAFGPVYITADELPEGGRGLRIETRLNGEVVQSSNTDRMIFDVATLVSTISEVMTVLPGDLIVTGTPAGIGHSRTPKLYMKPGDQVEVEIEGIGILRNGIVDEAGKETAAGKVA